LEADQFAPGTFIAADGTLSQSAGILITDTTTPDLTVSGLQPGQRYLYRVRALRETEPSVTQPARVAQTTAIFRLIDQWRNAVFAGLLHDPRSALTADYDGDGISNGAEYAMGRDALRPDIGADPLVYEQDGYLHLSYRRPELIEDVAITPQATGTLTLNGWSSAAIVPVSVSAPDAFGIQTVIVRDSVPISSSERRFLRVRYDF
jgi:hypothetical protein